MPNFDFSNPEHTKYLWEQILSHWSHRDRPAGQRFLGSVRLKQQSTDELLNIVGCNLRQLNRITYQSLYENFYELKQNWLKILTFALSEYAYHYSSTAEKFWYGFCQQLKIPYSQAVENTLRQIVDEGINLLGLVRTQGGYRYVSTLWLQSGIPKQNLTHFSCLVQEVSNEYGWWELSHAPYEDLSQELLDFCQNKHPHWGTLIHFLKSSCPNGKDKVEPISGQLVQGIATVAQDLERKGDSPELLRDDNQREDLLVSYYLPQNFFLRNWDTLIQVLTPKERQGGNRRVIISQRKKPLSLILDVADSLNIQLILPEQNLRCAEWKNLSETFCQILESGWEGTIPDSGVLSIPEQVVNINTVRDRFHWQLLNHKRSCLIEWHLEGVTSDFPCLIFDAWSGEHIPLHLPNPSINRTEEIIYFIPKDVHLAFANGIEIIDSCVPSSIRGWVGQHIRLTTKESSIVFTTLNLPISHSIIWKLFNNEQPQLKGLKLNGKKSTYLEIPTFWYRPDEQATSLNISIDSLTRQLTVINITEPSPVSNSWQSISLTKWITESGSYEARFWNQFHRWSYRFEIKADYRLTSKPDSNELKLSSFLQGQITNLPIKYNASEKFWSEVVNLKGLWPLEVVTFSLSNGEDKVFYLGQADSSGNLNMSLAVLHDCLPDSDWYALDYQQLGFEPQRLVDMEIAAQSISWTWANQTIHISGLQSDQMYFLSCWNLLLPQSQPVKLNIPLILQGEEVIIISLNLPVGIYHIQLTSSRQLTQSLGWWCGSQENELPDEIQANELLENYCYTILGNEDLEDFLKAVKALNMDWDLQWLQTVIPSLQDQEKGYHFPEWLKSDALFKKVQALIQQQRIILPPPPETTKFIDEKKSGSEKPSKGTWHLVTLTQANKRELFYKHPALPLSLTKHQIVSLLRSSISPNQPQESLTAEVEDALDELQAQGEILAGVRNRYGMAPPTVLTENQEDLTGLLFQGDRAYLSLAHQALESQPKCQNLLLIHPQVKRFHWIKDRLNQVGIRLLTAAESIENLPVPRKPLKSQLRSPWPQDPYSISSWTNREDIERYVPGGAIQKDRWRYPHRESLKNQDLLRLPTGEYLWFEDEAFYELEPDVAILAMFQLDAEMGCPLKICWDKPQGRLNLQGVILPSAYARWLWRLSEPDMERYRNRYFQPASRFVEAAFKRLGSILV